MIESLQWQLLLRVLIYSTCEHRQWGQHVFYSERLRWVLLGVDVSEESIQIAGNGREAMILDRVGRHGRWAFNDADVEEWGGALYR